MISFDAAHRAVHYPNDRRFRIWIKPSILALLIVLCLLPLVLASCSCWSAAGFRFWWITRDCI